MRIHIDHTIDAGHRVVGHKGKCAMLHGHTYRFEIELHGYAENLVGPGFIMDFGDVKAILNDWDHKMLLWDKDPVTPEWGQSVPNETDIGVLRVPFNPTAEEMAKYLCRHFTFDYENITDALVRVWETPKTFAECTS